MKHPRITVRERVEVNKDFSIYVLVDNITGSRVGSLVVVAKRTLFMKRLKSNAFVTFILNRKRAESEECSYMQQVEDILISHRNEPWA